MAADQPDEVLSRWPGLRWARLWARHRLGLAAWIAGDRAEAERLFTVPPAHHACDRLWFAHAVMVPFLRRIADGDDRAWRLALAAVPRDEHQQRPWHLARWLLGELDDAAFLAQPHPFATAHWLILGRAMRADAADDAGAAALYREWLALPRHTREGDIVIERFAAWRATLAR